MFMFSVITEEKIKEKVNLVSLKRIFVDSRKTHCKISRRKFLRNSWRNCKKNFRSFNRYFVMRLVFIVSKYEKTLTKNFRMVNLLK